MRNRYVVFSGVRQVDILEEVLPDTPPSGTLLVRSEYTFISAGTELANLTGQEPKVFQPGSWCAYPWRPGYAQVGRVCAVGAGAACDWAVGERVFTLGAHADYALRTAKDLVIRVPDGLDPLLAVASRMAGVAAAAIVAKPPDWFAGGWVAVCGLGMVGNLAAQCCRILGARVVGIDPLEARRRLATQCGIDRVVPAGPGAAEAVRAAIGGEAPHLVIEATGRSDVAVQAIELVADHGHVILLGSPRAPHTGDITGLLSAIHLRNLSVHGALEWSLPAAQPPGFNSALSCPIPNLTDKQRLLFAWVASGRLSIRPLISHVVKPSAVADAYRGLQQQPDAYTGVAIDWRMDDDRTQGVKP
jgi:2-desacetyl-2-hydroxyethyl bacteriochlorophyllide A dehydrogenase